MAAVRLFNVPRDCFGNWRQCVALAVCVVGRLVGPQHLFRNLYQLPRCAAPTFDATHTTRSQQATAAAALNQHA